MVKVKHSFVSATPDSTNPLEVRTQTAWNADHVIDTSTVATIPISQLAADPSTAGWGEAEKGLAWFNTLEGKYKYWNGVAVVAYPSTGGAGAPTDASYVTINAEAGLSGEVQHANITDQAQLHIAKYHKLTHQTGGTDEISLTGLSGLSATAQTPAAHTLASHSTKAHSELTGVSADQHHAQAHEAAHKSGGADALLSTDLIEAIIKRLQESSGPTTLTVGNIADNMYLKRSGTGIVGAAGTGTSVYQLAPKYTVYKSGATYYAMSNVGGIDYSGSSLSMVMNNALSLGLTGGRKWMESVLMKGDLTLDYPILVPSWTDIGIDGTITLEDGVDDSMFKNDDQTNGNIAISLHAEGGRAVLNQNGPNQSAGRCVDFYNLVTPADDWSIHWTNDHPAPFPTYIMSNIDCWQGYQEAARFKNGDAATQFGIYNCNFEGGIDGSSYGLLLDHCADSEVIGSSLFGDLGLNANGGGPLKIRMLGSNSGKILLQWIPAWSDMSFGFLDNSGSMDTLQVQGCTYLQLHDTLFNIRASTNTYDAVKVTDSSAHCNFYGLTFGQINSGSGATFKYGIEEVDNSENYNVYSALNGCNTQTGVLRQLGVNGKPRANPAQTIIGTVVLS